MEGRIYSGPKFCFVLLFARPFHSLVTSLVNSFNHRVN